ncbi:MAG: hypothetical protein K6D57_04435 [Paludibacteraceae bacterium]|nr:hypothetical protein [Paludibacteraceae bacterium]
MEQRHELVARVLTRSAAVRIVRMLVGEEVSVLAGVVLKTELPYIIGATQVVAELMQVKLVQIKNL